MSDEIAVPEPQLWRGIYAIGAAGVAVAGAYPVYVVWKHGGGAMTVTWGDLAIPFVLMWVAFVGTPWIAWAFARRWALWKLAQQQVAQRQFEARIEKALADGLARIDAALDDGLKNFDKQIRKDRDEFADRVEQHLRQTYDVERFPRRGR